MEIEFIMLHNTSFSILTLLYQNNKKKARGSLYIIYKYMVNKL